MNKIILLLLLVLGVSASSIEVTLISPSLSKDTINIYADGIVIAKNKTILTVKSTGVLKLFINNNSIVEKGDKIAYIMNERRLKNLKLFKKKLLLENTQIRAQELKLSNAKDMYKMGVSSKNLYLSEELLFKRLQETYQDTKTKYKLLQLEEKNAFIFAKKEMIISKLLAENSYISYGMSIATILSKDTIVKLFVDAKYIKELTKGMSVNIKSNYADIKGKISHILFQSSNNLVEVIVSLEDKLPLNSYISASISLKDVNGLSILKKSVVLVNNHPAVYIIKNSTAHLFFIDIIKDTINKVLIKNTLPKNSKIAFKNAYLLHDNLKVDVQ